MFVWGKPTDSSLAHVKGNANGLPQFRGKPSIYNQIVKLIKNECDETLKISRENLANIIQCINGPLWINYKLYSHPGLILAARSYRLHAGKQNDYIFFIP